MTPGLSVDSPLYLYTRGWFTSLFNSYSLLHTFKSQDIQNSILRHVEYPYQYPHHFVCIFTLTYFVPADMNHFNHLFAIAISDLRLFLWRAIKSNRYFPMDPPALCGKALAMYRELSKRAVQTCP